MALSLIALNLISAAHSESGSQAMPDYVAQRFNMVESQVRTSDVPDGRIQAAMLEVPRDRFVPALKRALAYAETAVEIVPGRFLIEPRTLAKLLLLAELKAGDSALVIGAGTGYSAAVLGKIVATVTALESDVDMVRAANELFRSLGAKNVQVVQGALCDGFKPSAPYNVILIDAGVEEVPEAVVAQLAEGGRLVAVVMSNNNLGQAHIFVRNGRNIGERRDFDAMAPVLPGFRKTKSFVF
jgi:protein-L-isoaspartate(D-aspartate) O-methyltransferase